MPADRWKLTDRAEDVYVENLNLGRAELGADLRLAKRRLRGGLSDGVDVVELAAGPLRVLVLPTRGMGIWKANWDDVEIGWQSPTRGPVNPALVPLFEPSGIGWLAGFDELLCRCGLESNGAPQFTANGTLQYPLHGRIANLPAHQVEAALNAETGELSVTGTVDETRLFGAKWRLESTVSVRRGERTISVQDRITNLSAQDGGLELLYHINFGHPLLTPQARVVAPVKTLAPRDAHSATDVSTWDSYPQPQASVPELVHFADMAGDRSGRTRTLLETTPGGWGVSVVYNANELPTFTLWKLPLKPEDGYVTGLEPGINYPNIRAFEQEQGRVAQFKPHESREYRLSLEIHPDAASVQAAKDDVAALTQSVERKILAKPRVDWSPS